VLLGGIPRVLEGLNVVSMRQLGVVGGFLKPSLHVLLSGFQMLLGGLLEMFSCLLVMFSCLLRHGLKTLSRDFDLEPERDNKGLSAAWPTLKLPDC
jgi:hypothetical protein